MEEINFPDVLYENHLKEISGIKFTRREVEIIAFILSGRSRKKIASFLSISPKTVENHTRNIMEKFGCNSRENIIDLIEKSGKLLFIKQYYLNWLIHTEFEEILRGLAFSNGKLSCSVVSWSFEKNEYTLLPYLKNHLNLAGVKVTYDTRHKQQSLSSILPEPTNGTYKLYLLPKFILEEARYHPTNKCTGYPKNLKSKLFILPSKIISEELYAELADYDCIDLSQTKNYYFLIFEILRKFFENQQIERVFVEFQDKMSILWNAPHSEDKPLQTIKKNQSTPKVHTFIMLQHVLKNRSYFDFLILFCLGLSILWIYYYQDGLTKSNPLHHLNGREKWLARSDLIIPTDSFLLERTELLNQMTSKFKKHPETIQTIVLVGIGGAGKTTLARQYARLQEAAIIWEMHAESRESLLASFESLALALVKTEDEKREIKGIQEIQKPTEKEDKIIQWVKTRLLSSKNWLILYDNVVSFKNIQNYFPCDHNTWGIGKVLITTRNSQMSNNVNDVLLLTELSDTEKLNLFTKILTSFSDNNSLSSHQMEEIKKFLIAIPPFPLDVTLAAHYLKRTNVSFVKYLSYLSEYDPEFENLQQKVLKEVGDYHKTRYSIIALSLKDLLENHKDFTELLLFVSLLNPRDISRDLLITYKKDVVVDNFIHDLQAYSLINGSSPFQKNTLLSIHPSIQESCLIYLQNILNLETNKHLLKPLAYALEMHASESIRQQDFHKVNNLASHCYSFLSHSDFLTDETKGIVGGELGNIYLHLSNYNAAQKILEESLAHLKKQNHQKQHNTRIARLSIYLADVYREIGNYGLAKNLLEDSLYVFRSHLPKDKLSVAMNLTHLGAVYRHLGDFRKSKELLEEGIDVYQRCSVGNQTDVAWASVHLGNTYREMGDLFKATDLLEKSLLIYSREFSKNHPTTAWNLAQLGNMYREMGKFEKASALLEESLAIYEKNFPYSHDRIAWNLTHLGDIYTYLGDHTKALSALEKALLIHEKHFSKNHAGVARTLMCLGNAYRESGNYQQAKDALEKSLNVHLRHFSEKHLRLAPVYMNLGLAYRELGHYNEAKDFLKKSLDSYKRNSGGHPIETARVLRNLGQVYLMEGDLDSSKKLMQQAQEIAQKIEHPDVARTFESLADLYLQRSIQVKGDQQEGYKKQAIDCLTQALEIIKTHLPKNKHHKTRIENKILKIQGN